MRSTTVRDIVEAVRDLADIRYSQVVRDDELLRYVNDSYTSLFDLLVTADEDYYLSFATFDIIPNTGIYNLPDNFYKLRGVDYYSGAGGEPITLLPFNFRERNKFPAFSDATLRYRIVANSLVFTPAPRATASITMWYVQSPAKFSSLDDIIDGVAGWDEYIKVDAAIKCKEKQELDASQLLLRKAELEKRIEHASQERDLSQSDRIADVRGRSFTWENSIFPWE
jgi:hypothetical protein